MDCASGFVLLVVCLSLFGLAFVALVSRGDHYERKP